MRSDWTPDSGGGVWLWLVRHVPNHPRTWAVAFMVMALGLIGLGELVLWQIVQSNNEKTGQHMSMWYPLMLQLLVLVVAGSVSIRNYRRRG